MFWPIDVKEFGLLGLVTAFIGLLDSNNYVGQDTNTPLV